MGAMDRFLNAMRLNSDDEDDDYYDEDDFYDEDEEYEEDDYDEPERRPFFRNRRDRDLDSDMDDEDDFEDEGGSPFNIRRGSSRSDFQQNNSKVTPMRASRRNSGGASGSSMEVCVIKPISVEDAREITETLIANRTVVLNLEGLDLEIAQRIIDFTSGSCYAIGGNLQKVSNYIFIVTPSHVDISGDYQDIMSAFGGSSLQMDI